MAASQYHHGDLRRALLDATVALVAENGINGFTLRETARRAGVSHSAPFHHFSSRSAMVAAAAFESLEMLAECMAAAVQKARANGAMSPGQIEAVGLAYVHFAIEHPERFRLMFRPELREGADALETDGPPAAYQIVIDIVSDGQARGEFSAGNPEELARTAWATVHGLASLMLDGPLAADGGNWLTAEPLAHLAVRHLLLGIQARKPG